MSEVMALYAGAIGLHGKVATGAKKIEKYKVQRVATGYEMQMGG